jgi:hypothetical protein
MIHSPNIARPTRFLAVWIIGVVVLVISFLFAAVSNQTASKVFAWTAVFAVPVSILILVLLVLRMNSTEITKPTRFLAVWFIGVVVLVISFLFAAVRFDHPTPTLFAWTAVAVVPGSFLILLYFLLFRFQLRSESQYRSRLDESVRLWQEWEQGEFVDFDPHKTQDPSTEDGLENEPVQIRQKYETHQGLFLVHSWRPSTRSGQVADALISLQEHPYGTKPLTNNKVESVEYQLDLSVSTDPIIVQDATNNFGIFIALNRPVLCLAKVTLSNGSTPLTLERYISFF